MKKFYNLKDLINSINNLAKNNHVQKAMTLLFMSNITIDKSHHNYADSNTLNTFVNENLVSYFDTKYVNNPDGKNRPNYFLKINEKGLPVKVTKQDVLNITKSLEKSKQSYKNHSNPFTTVGA